MSVQVSNRDSGILSGECRHEETVASDDKKNLAIPFRDLSGKKYPCKLCDRAFDRPSTILQQSEEAFSCHICGRRFSIRSNRNRHVRRCTVRQDLFLARKTEFQEKESTIPMQLNDVPQQFTSDQDEVALKPSINDDRGQRRKPCSLIQWMPVSLLSFTILTRCIPSPIPLPAAKPYGMVEERNSYAICHLEPYIKKGWNGQRKHSALTNY